MCAGMHAPAGRCHTGFAHAGHAARLAACAQVNLWGLDAIKTKGESVAIVLHLLGARPISEGASLNMQVAGQQPVLDSHSALCAVAPGLQPPCSCLHITLR